VVGGNGRGKTTHQFPALRERLDRPAGGLSGGQPQMLAVARG
jgi:ABC-type branched-subunit amino acid transport system ATPase component